MKKPILKIGLALFVTLLLLIVTTYLRSTLKKDSGKVALSENFTKLPDSEESLSNAIEEATSSRGTSPGISESTADPTTTGLKAPIFATNAKVVDKPIIRRLVKRVISERWISNKAVNGQAARQRVRIVEADFKYPMLRLEEDVTLDSETGEEISEIRRSSVADHLLVGLERDVDPDVVKPLFEERGYKVRSIEEGSFLLVEMPQFENIDDQALAMEHLSELDEFINFAEPDWIVRTTTTPNDPAFFEGKAWSFDNPGTVAGTLYDADIDGPDGWDQRSDASSIVVAVTDTGIRYTHEDLAANMWTDESGQHGFDAYDDDMDPMDTNGHGTHVAGIIGARGDNGLGTAGVAWRVQLMALRFIGPNGGTTSDAIRVINYSRLNGAHIINASWGGGGYSEGLANAIKACYAADIPVVAAAGNFTRDNDTIIHYPSGYHTPNVVAVASSDANDELSFFSNYGNTFVDLAAPGADIWSCGIASDSDYRYLSGTSMAAPHVTGALALAKAHYPGESFVDLIVRLYNSVDTRPSLNRKVSTGGRLNLYRLLADSSPSYLHDDFEKPYWFFGCYGYWCYSNARMTREADEDQFSPDTGQKSLWFRWTAPSDGLVRFKGEGAVGDVSVVAFEGVDRHSLKRIADNFKQRPTKSSYLYFYAKVGRTYTFSVDSRLDTPQIIIGELVHRPVNDMWRDATDLGNADRIDVRGNNCGATAEPWENTSPHAGVGNGRSVWWKWTPDFSGDFIFSTQASSFDTVLAVYKGSSPGSLIEVASNDDRNPVDWTSEVSFNVVAGTTYYVAVDSYRGSGYGNIMLNGYVPGSLFILKQPENKLARIGDRVSFQVAAAGQGLRYQWELDGQAIPGAVQPHYTILRIVNEDLGSYRVRISDIANTIVSDVVTLAELQISPQIVWQSLSRSVSLGSSLDLRVRATGTPPLIYQWFKNGTEIPGATTDQISLNNVDGSAAANYTVTVGNATGYTTSDTIDLKVFSSPWNAWSYVDPTTQSGEVFSIINHDDKWVAAARAPNSIRISTSADGKNWNHDFIKPDGNIYNMTGLRLVRGNGFWMCTATASGALNGLIFKSTDLVNWQQHLLPNGVSASSQMIFHDGYFYLSSGNFLHRTSDGINWTLQQTPIGVNIKSEILLSDGGSRLVAAKKYWEKIYVLDDPAGSWQEIDVDATTTNWVDAAYTKDGQFYVYLSNTRYESVDGLTWTQSTSTPSPDPFRELMWQVNQASNSFVYSDYGGKKLYASLDDGVNWSRYLNMLPEGVSAAASDENRIVFGTDLGGLFATDEPFTETYPVRRFNDTFVGVGYEGGRFLAQYWRSTMVSSDGERWTTYPSQVIGAEVDAPPYASVPVWIGDEYWQVGYPQSNLPAIPFYRGDIPGVVRLSAVAGLPNGVLTDFCEGSDGILSVQIPHLASSGSLAKSTDNGVSWSALTVPGGNVSKHADVSYKGSHYFYDAYLGNTYASADLVNWIDLGATTEVIFHQGEYWVFNGVYSRRSPDLVNWSPTVSMPQPGIFDVNSYNGALVGLQSGVIAYSYDGVNWVPMNVGFTVSDITTSGDVLLAGGTQGQLAYTGNAPETSPSVSILEPAEDASYLAGSVISVKVDAFSPDQLGDPTVRLYYDGTFHAQLSAPPYEFDLQIGTAGQHLIHVECQNGTGPVALARKRIIVSEPPSVNHFTGINGVNSLPGAIVRKKGVFISSSSGGISTSVDGLNWSPASLPASIGSPQYFVEGDDRILAYAAGTKAAITLDGVSWFGVTLPGTPAVRIQYSNGMFWSMTSGGGAMNGMLTSQDGVNWTLRSLSQAPSSLDEVIGDPFGILLGRTYSSALWRSLDGGRTWSAVTGFSYVTSLSHNGQRFFINEGNGSSRRAGSSVDGINWIWSDPDSRNYFVSLVNGTAFARDTQGVVFSLSYDGLTWQLVNGSPLGETVVWSDDGYFYGKGSDPQEGGIALLRSQNGIDWDFCAPWPTSEAVSLIPSSNGIFGSTTGGGLWKYSNSTSTWVQLYVTRTSAPNFYDFAKDGSMIIAINNGKTLVKSEDDGQTWETIYDPGVAQSSQHNHSTILTLNGIWLSWSPGTRLIRSVDGQSFSDITTTSGSNSFKAITHNDSNFAAIRDDGAFMVSSDGLIWSQSAPPGSFPDVKALKLVADGMGWRALSIGPGSFFPPLKLSSSPDGATWNQTQVSGTYTSGTPVLATTSIGDIAGRSSCRFSADGSTWVTTSANSSTIAYKDVFHHVKNGWLERSVNGTTWQQIRFFGNSFAKTKVVDGALYLFGSDGSFSKYTEKDIAISEVEAAPSTYAVGETLNVSFVLTNEGSEPTPSGNFETQVFLSIDSFHGNEDDQALGTAIVTAPVLQPGESATLQVQAIIPNMLQPGQYRAGIWYDRQGSVNEINSSNNFAITMLQPVDIPGFLLSTSSVGNGVIAQDTGQRLFASGARVSLNATSGKGASFVGWGGDALGTESQVTILMDQNRNVQATFTSQVDLQVFIRGGGRVTGAGDQGLFTAGETASLQAVPASGWVFSEWTGAVSGASPNASLLMDAPKVVTASFVLPLQAWKNTHFTPTELLDPIISGNNMDPDGDGLENWKEYLHGSNPRDAQSKGIVQTKIEGGYLSLIFTRLAGTEGNYVLTCNGSRDLSNWDSPDFEERILRTANGIETVEARLLRTGQLKGFIRFSYQQ